jgi:hypothetical protein
MTVEQQELQGGSQTLRKLLLGLLWLTVALAPVALALDLVERNVLVGIQDLSFSSNEEMINAADASDRNQLVMGIIQFIVFVVSTVVWFMWVFRSNKLARALGATSMSYSPGWSVGWFFIPIANLFKPYFAMKEIYLATMDPLGFDVDQEVESQPESLNILKLWWLVYLIDRFFSTASARTAFRADTVEELLTANGLTLASDVATVVASLATIWLVRELSRQQDIKFAGPEMRTEPQTTSA